MNEMPNSGRSIIISCKNMNISNYILLCESHTDA